MAHCLKYCLKKAWIFPGLLILCVLVSVPAALAQTTRDINNRISRLENEIETLSRAVYRGDSLPPPAGRIQGDATAQGTMELRLQQLERELQDMRGTLEEQAHETRQLKEKLMRITGDMEMRLDALEGRRTSPGEGRVSYGAGGAERIASGAAPPSAGGGAQDYRWNSVGGQSGTYNPPSEAGVEAPQNIDPAASSYERAFALLKNAEYDAAERAFQAFIDRYPDHELVGNAKYWLGETFYVRGDFEKAARIFAEGYQKYPQGAKAADNLLKLGMALSGMGNTEDACVALAQLGKDGVPSSTQALRRAEQEMRRLECP